MDQALDFGRRYITYLHVVTTALLARRVRHLSELQRKDKSMIFATDEKHSNVQADGCHGGSCEQKMLVSQLFEEVMISLCNCGLQEHRRRHEPIQQNLTVRSKSARDF